MKTFAFISLLMTALAGETPLTREQAYQVYSNFLGTWETKGNWSGGAPFHQEITVEMELTKNIFTVKTRDYVDSKQFDDGQRNFGIRAWDKKEQTMKFWEFDVFGGITSGEVVFQGNDVYLVYEYPDENGQTRTLADAWIYVDKDTYLYKVGEFVDGRLGKEFMSSTYKRK